MKKIDLEIFDISLNGGNSGAYVMVLMEKGGNRKIPILIGGFEAQYIAIELENMKPSRPLTHDLFKSTLSSFELNVTEVVIIDYKEGVFFAKIVVTDGEKIVEVDSRSSDAVAIAVRFRAPIRCYEAVLEATGITPEEEAEINRDETELEEQDLDEHDVEDDEALSLNLETTEVDEDQSSNKEDDVESAVKFDEDFKKRNILELKKNLNDAIRNEDYESASKIRDKIDKINSDN
ncbi:MAG: bifunctional nuclease domain-containing protein [Flavobacteriales bacterium]